MWYTEQRVKEDWTIQSTSTMHSYLVLTTSLGFNANKKCMFSDFSPHLINWPSRSPCDCFINGKVIFNISTPVYCCVWHQRSIMFLRLASEELCHKFCMGVTCMDNSAWRSAIDSVNKTRRIWIEYRQQRYTNIYQNIFQRNITVEVSFFR